MIDKTVIVETLLQRLAKLPIGEYLDMRTYKRNRAVIFVRQDEDTFLVIEEGFERQRFESVPRARLKKLIKTLLQREFPRSTKIRVYTMGRFDEETWRAMNRKVL
jgi:hypothetical protein